jgi:hypothetical protein
MNNCLALHAIANIGGSEMADTLAPDVHRLLISPSVFLRSLLACQLSGKSGQNLAGFCAKEGGADAAPALPQISTSRPSGGMGPSHCFNHGRFESGWSDSCSAQF